MDTEDEDIFADDEDVQELRRADATYYAMTEQCIDVLKSQLSLEEILEETDDVPDLSLFELFKPVLNLINNIQFYKSGYSGYSVSVFLVTYHCPGRGQSVSGTGEDKCLYGLITSHKEFPETFIYKEKFSDRLVNLFAKGDVDFKEHQEFSKAFHVVTRDKEKLNLLIANKPLDKLSTYSELEIEISGCNCFFRPSKETIDPEVTQSFIQLTKILTEIFC